MHTCPCCSCLGPSLSVAAFSCFLPQNKILHTQRFVFQRNTSSSPAQKGGKVVEETMRSAKAKDVGGSSKRPSTAGATISPSETLAFLSWAKPQAKLWDCKIVTATPSPASSADETEKARVASIGVKLKQSINARALEDSAEGNINSICWNQNGQLLATASSDGNVTVVQLSKSISEALEPSTRLPYPNFRVE